MAAAALALAACSLATFTPSSRSVVFTPKAEDCEFRLVSTHPGPGYEEIGLLDPMAKVSKASQFKDLVRDEVCKVGGDVVIAEVNASGDYVHGVVLRALPAPRPDSGA